MTIVQDAYTTKMAARFATFDRDHDGRVTVDDFEAMARSVLLTFGLPPESAKGRELMAGARAFFTGLAEVADADDDGAITESEFVSAAQDRLRDNPGGFAVIVRPWAEAVVSVADANGDGTVDLEEWERTLCAMGAAPHAAAEQAAHVDSDGDGVVSVAEVLATAVAFYTDSQAGHEFDQA
ncbi:EF-hand domain-containing protein [Actinosynnema sp. CA-299493]